MKLTMDVAFSGFDIQIDDKAIVDTVGPELAQRVKERAATKLHATGQLAESIAFKDGEIAPQGMRLDSDTHKSRPPISNRALAVMHAAKGRGPVDVTDEDEQHFARRVEEELQRIFDEGGAR